ncbi:MAG: preprotein translocase subunit SecE [Planctomycetia bacterium]
MATERVRTMATTQENSAAGGSLWSELLSFSVYKRNQGRVTRQATFAALAVTLAIGVWRLAQVLPLWLSNASSSLSSTAGADLGVYRFLVPGLLLAAGLWFVYRLVNVPRFADFLIAVESEMAKVSWPTTGEVARSSAVVIFLIFALAAILAAYDLFWWFVLRAIQGFK